MIEGLAFAKHPKDPATGLYVRKIKSAEQMQEMGQAYFDSLMVMGEEITTDKDGNEIRRPYVIHEKKAGKAGLAAFLGIHRSYLFEYMQMTKAELAPIQHVLRAALSTIEAEQEQYLFDRETSRGAEFSLRCNFGWGESGQGRAQVVEPEIEEPDDDALAIPKWQAPQPAHAAAQIAAQRQEDVFGPGDT